MLKKMLVHAFFSGLILILLDVSNTDYSVDSRIPAYFFSSGSFLMALAFQGLYKIRVVYKFFLSAIVYSVTWWVLIIFSMFLCGIFEESKFMSVYLRNGVSGSRFYFFSMFLVFFMISVIIEFLNTKYRTKSVW